MGLTPLHSGHLSRTFLPELPHPGLHPPLLNSSCCSAETLKWAPEGYSTADRIHKPVDHLFLCFLWKTPLLESSRDFPGYTKTRMQVWLGLWTAFVRVHFSYGVFRLQMTGNEAFRAEQSGRKPRLSSWGGAPRLPTRKQGEKLLVIKIVNWCCSTHRAFQWTKFRQNPAEMLQKWKRAKVWEQVWLQGF